MMRLTGIHFNYAGRYPYGPLQGEPQDCGCIDCMDERFWENDRPSPVLESVTDEYLVPPMQSVYVIQDQRQEME